MADELEKFAAADGVAMRALMQKIKLSGDAGGAIQPTLASVCRFKRSPHLRGERLVEELPLFDMSQPIERPFLARAEYWSREQTSGLKHEYCRGEVFAMAGGTPKHAQISGNVYFQVRSRLGGRCRVNTSDQSVYVEETDMATYPDVSVACGPKYHSELTSSLVNPCVIVEVLSPSTEAYDRGKKFAHYKRLESLKEYVLVATDDYAVDHYLREAGGTWTLTSFTGLETSVRFPSLDVVVSMVEIYADVDPSEIAEESPRPPGVDAPRLAKIMKRP